MAASFALVAASRVQRSAWLVDLDLRRNSAWRGFDEGFAEKVGRPGRPYDASLKTEPIYQVTPRPIAVEGERKGDKLLTVHEIEGTHLLVTRFRNEQLRRGQRVQIRTQPAWWSALRKIADWIVVDAPSIERSPAGLAMASQMDGVVIVVEADSTSAEDVVGLRRELEAYGGHVVGIAMNRVRGDARFADRLSG